MDANESDGWMASLLDIQLETTKKAVDECNRLRRRVRELEAQIAVMPSVAYELQERITLLERELANVRGSSMPAGVRDEPKASGGAVTGKGEA